MRDSAHPRVGVTSRHVGLIVCGLLAVVVWIAPSANGGGAARDGIAQAARIVDERLLCTVSIRGGVPLVLVDAAAGPRNPTTAEHARLAVYSGFGNSSEYAFTWASAGVRGRNTFVVGPKCRGTRRAVGLNASGLKVRRLSQDGVEFRCFAPRRVLVRVRAVFRTPTRLVRGFGGARVTGAAVREASVSVRTESGKPMVFASINEAGQARLGTSGDCFPD
jgi:hypothetical protein